MCGVKRELWSPRRGPNPPLSKMKPETHSAPFKQRSPRLRCFFVAREREVVYKKGGFVLRQLTEGTGIWNCF